MLKTWYGINEYLYLHSMSTMTLHTKALKHQLLFTPTKNIENKHKKTIHPRVVLEQTFSPSANNRRFCRCLCSTLESRLSLGE